MRLGLRFVPDYGCDLLCQLLDSAGRDGVTRSQGIEPYACAQPFVFIFRRVDDVPTGRDRHQHLLRDRLEIGAEVNRALEHEDLLILRLRAEMAEWRLVV